MKRLLLSCCILLCAVSTLKAQEQPLISPDDSIRSLVGRLFPNSNPNLSAHMNLQFSTSGVANFIEGDLEDASFKLNRVKLEILGSFSKQFSYHFRQSFNKYSNPHSLDNLSSSIEYALVNWKMSDRFALTVGNKTSLWVVMNIMLMPSKSASIVSLMITSVVIRQEWREDSICHPPMSWCFR